MSEREPGMTFSVGDEKFEVRRDNAVLWTFLGRTAIDHVWLEQELQEDGRMAGRRFWREVFPDEVFNSIAVYMISNEFESHLNMREVPESDMDAYIRWDTSSEETPDWLK